MEINAKHRERSGAAVNMLKYKALYLEHAPEDVCNIIKGELPPGFELLTLKGNREEERRALLGKADFLLVATVKVDDALLDLAPKVKLIQHQGVGYDNIDVAAAWRRGIPVALTPEGTTVGVAEHTILLILAVYKHLPRAHNSLRRGEWLQFPLRPHSFELQGKTLGLVGMGRIGREVAKRALPFGCRIIFHDPYVVDEIAEGTGVGLYELAAQADIVSIHTPLTSQTKGLINAEFLGKMKESAILINTARGGVVDEGALIYFLQQKRIAGAGLDVFAKEPPDPDNLLFALDNVVLTPHIAAGTKDALREKMQAAFANMVRVSRGEEPIHVIRPAKEV